MNRRALVGVTYLGSAAEYLEEKGGYVGTSRFQSNM